MFTKCLVGAPLAVLLGGGYEMLKVCLEDAETICCTVLLKTWQGQKRHRPSQVHSRLLP